MAIGNIVKTLNPKPLYISPADASKSTPPHNALIRAIRHGHAKLHRGLDIGVPSLILRSKVTHFSRRYSSNTDVADAVLDVRQIARWAGCLGDRTTVVPIEGARHDVFLSQQAPRTQAFAEVDEWLDWLYRSARIERESGKNHNEMGTVQ